MPKGGPDEFCRAGVIRIATNINILNHLGDAVLQEELGGMIGLVASEIEIRPTGAP